MAGDLLKAVINEIIEERDALKENIATGMITVNEKYPYDYWVIQVNVYDTILKMIKSKLKREFEEEFMEDDKGSGV